MSFVQREFLSFFLVVFALYWVLPSRRVQNLLLVVASAVFYGWIHPWFLLLLYGSAILDYGVGLGMAQNPDRKNALLGLSLAGNLGLLGVFKYLDFFLENVVAASEALGLHSSVHVLGIFLPAGISFYTFQTMSYTIDVYRGKLEPRRDFLDYVVFISFFPQLVAGPVERAATLLPQMEQPRRFDAEKFQSGLGLALFGAFKKVAIADTVAPFVDKVFTLTDPSFFVVWAGVIGFTIQLLGDFSGYTDIARGTARMLGFELSENFRHPYAALTPSDFWRRWHITFSTWIRDYVYVPVVASRNPTWLRATVATWVAMLVSGIWHGAAWNFVLWGAYFGLLATLYQAIEPRLPAALRSLPGGRLGAIALMYALICVAMLIFRAGPLSRLELFLTLDPRDSTPAQLQVAASLLAIFLGCAAPLWFAMASERWLRPRLAESPWRLPVRVAFWTVHALAIASFVRVSAEDFVYFAF